MLEAPEKRKRRDPDVRVWDRFVRVHHWLLVLAFATLYLESKKFPVHPYAGYAVTLLVTGRIAWGFLGRGAARFSNFMFTPRQTISYLKDALKGGSSYYFSHNPLGAAMVYALLILLLLNCLLGMLAYSASQELGPFSDRVSHEYEDALIAVHVFLGHCIAALIPAHLLGVLWASRQHRENYVLAMLTGLRRIPRSVPLPPGATRPGAPGFFSRRFHRQLEWLNYKRPLLGSIILMTLIVLGFALPLSSYLASFNARLFAY